MAYESTAPPLSYLAGERRDSTIQPQICQLRRKIYHPRERGNW